MSDSLWPHGRQHTGLPCLSLSPRVCSNVHRVDDAIQPSHPRHPLLLLPLIFPIIRVFYNESAFCIMYPKYWSLSSSPFNEYSELISFRTDWFDPLVIQGTLKNLLQHHNSKASVLHHPAFIMVQLSHLYMTTGKTIILIIWTFVGKVMSLLFNMLSRFAIAFLPRSKHLSAIRVVSCAYLRLLIFLPAILIPACESSSLAFHIM